MRSIHPLAIAGVLVALAGCSPAPQAPTTDVTQTAPASPVTLRTQGLLTAKLEAGTVKVTKGALLSPSDINTTLGYLVSKETALPTGAQQRLYLKKAQEGIHYLPVAEQEATHRFYQFPALRDEDLANLSVSLHPTSGGGAPLAAQMSKTDDGKLWVPFPDSGAYSALVSLKNTAPAGLYFQRASGTPVPTQYDFSSSPSSMINYPASQVVLLARVAVRDAKGEPLSGLTQDNLEFRFLAKLNNVEYQLTLPIALTEPQKGLYQLAATSYSYGSAAASYVIDLKIKNKPLIHDVDY